MSRVWSLALIWLMVHLPAFKAVAGMVMVGGGPQPSSAVVGAVRPQRASAVRHHGAAANLTAHAFTDVVADLLRRPPPLLIPA